MTFFVLRGDVGVSFLRLRTINLVDCLVIPCVFCFVGMSAFLLLRLRVIDPGGLFGHPWRFIYFVGMVLLFVSDYV